MTIYDRIDLLLKERRISRRRLARKIGVPESTLAAAFVRRPEHFPEKYIQAIAEALEMPREELVAGTENLHSDTIQPGAIVRHFKGKLYQIIGIAVHTETAEKMVIYQALYPPFVTYARPKDMFMSKVDEEKYPEHAGVWRIRMATPEEIRGQEENQNE